MILSTHGIVGSQIQSFVGLLDTYPNAAAAYSLRKLRAAYTGSAIRVRRTDLTESNIGFTAAGNLDTTALLAFTGTGALDNGFVTTWYDQSGNSQNALQTTAVNQPQIVSAGSVITENAKPAIQFQSLRWLQVANTTFGDIDDNKSAFYVAKLDNGTGNFPTIVAKSYNNDGSYTFGMFSSTGIIQEWADGVNYYDSSKADSRGSQLLLSNINITGTNGLKIYQNASLYAELTASTDLIGSNSFNYSIGRNPQDTNYYWVGTMQEIIPYASDQTSNRTGIETNINTYYGIY
jgi:hypothetical protein